MRPTWIIPGALLALAFQPARAEEPVVLRLTLAQALEQARASSPRLAQLVALERAAAAARDSASAALRPELDVTGGYQRLSHVPDFSIVLPIPGFEPRTIFPDLPDAWRARAQVSAPLYTGGRATHSIASATNELAASSRDVAAAGSDLMLETTAAYWSLVLARENERVLREALGTYEAHLVDARNRRAAGVAAANEVLAVQVERDQAELARLAAANSATVEEANLARLLGLPRGTRIEPADALEGADVTAPAPDALVAEALARRPERAALEARARAAEERATAQKAGARPQVVAAAGYDYANPNRRILPYADSWRGTWDVGVSASWAAFDGGRTSSAVAEARARADAARLALDDLDRRIRLEVEQRALDVQTAVASVGVAETAIGSARENRRVTLERYRTGVATSTELLDSETALLRAGLSRARALANVRTAQAGLARAVGESAPEPRP